MPLYLFTKNCLSAVIERFKLSRSISMNGAKLLVVTDAMADAIFPVVSNYLKVELGIFIISI